jgi:hypothetical protein
MVSLMIRGSLFVRLCGLWGLIVLSLAPQARAEVTFDPPLQVVTLPSTGHGDEVICTYYADLLIVRRVGSLPLTQCGHHEPANGIDLPTQGNYFWGRKDIFLLFNAADPSGAGGFAIFDADNGHRLFQDSAAADNWIKSVDISNNILRMHYIRGINADCSLLSDGKRCWEHLIESGQIPRGFFAGPPPGTICADSYRASHARQDDPNLLSYEVALVLDRRGRAQSRPLSAIHCEPVP